MKSRILVLFLFFTFLLNECIAITYYPKCASSYTSIVEALKSIGVDSSMDNRKKIAALNGYPNYSGTASQNISLLNKLKNGKLIKSNSDPDPGPNTSTTLMMNRLKKSSSYSAKKDTLVAMGTVLLDSGYQPAFVAGILGNIVAEGSVGKFESSNYVSHPELEPQYLKYMDSIYSYRTKYSGKFVTEVSLSELSNLMAKLQESSWKKGKFGLGCIQWTGGRTKNLVDLYVKYANGKDKITLEEATKAEGKMIGNELAGDYNYIYTNWKSNHSGNLNSASSAYDAGSDICIKYEVPADRYNKAVTRGNTAKDIYNIMNGN